MFFLNRFLILNQITSWLSDYIIYKYIIIIKIIIMEMTYVSWNIEHSFLVKLLIIIFYF